MILSEVHHQSNHDRAKTHESYGEVPIDLEDRRLIVDAAINTNVYVASSVDYFATIDLDACKIPSV